MPSPAGVVVPVRSFVLGNARLAERLGETARADLARRMADRVLDAAGGRPTVVVSSAPEVVAWAAGRGAACIDDPGSLDGAAAAGREWCRDRGLARVVVVHADLPFAGSLDPVAGDGGAPVVAAVPCHRGDGTPVLAVPAAAGFRFAYGPGSFARHVAEAGRLGLRVRIVRDSTLAFDVDLPEDLDALGAGTRPAPRP